MIEQIIHLLNQETAFKEIFKQLKCSDEDFLKALSIQQERDFTTVIHNDPNYNYEIVAY